VHVTANFDDLRELLGEPRFLWTDPQPWDNLERDLGIKFPEGYRKFVDAYGAVLINNQLTVFHPATVWYNLGEAIREEPGNWEDFPPEDLPPHPFGTGPGELFPWGNSASGEAVYFRVPRDDSDQWAIGVIEHDESGYYEYAMTFTEWMLAYLKGEEMAICSRNFAPDAPFFSELPQP
jgi:hypothetical protein